MSKRPTCCWTGCSAVAKSHKVLLCEEHFTQVGLRFIDERSVHGRVFQIVDKRTQEAAHRRLLDAHLEVGKRNTAHRRDLADRSVVYYVETGRYIKIGFTSDLPRRLSELRLHPTAVLATEPGGRALEAQRHAQFAADRIGRMEDFGRSLALLEHIRELQEAQL